MLFYGSLRGVAGLPASLAGTALSRLTDRMLALAIVLYALAQFASPSLAGWLTIAAVVPIGGLAGPA